MYHFRCILEDKWHSLYYRIELEDRKEDFESYAEFLSAVEEVPEALEIFGRMLETAPQGWDSSQFGEFPKDGALLLYTKLPSGNRSLKGK